MSATPDPSQKTSEFVFATCTPDSNAWLKRDVTRLHPALRLAFSRPGFVSWKAPQLAADFDVQTPVASVSGWGHGYATDMAQVGEKVVELLTSLRDPCVHVFAVGQLVTAVLAEQTTAELHAGLADHGVDLPLNGRARPGQSVIDVIVLQPAQWFVGWHVQRADKYALAGGVKSVPVDEASPSRAYSKVAELLLLGELSVRPGNVVVELGAAPGGATLFLLQQGARVWAIDPAPLAPSVVEFGSSHGNALTALELPAADVTRAQLPKQVDYLVSDVNLAPTVSLRYLERLCALVSGPKRGVLVNIKINDDKAEAMLPAVLDKAKALGQRIDRPICVLPNYRVTGVKSALSCGAPTPSNPGREPN